MHIPGTDVESKLALTEFLLSNKDVQASARRALDWLAAHSAVEQAIIAIRDQLTGQVLLVAEYGVTSSNVVDFGFSDDPEHPLVRALLNPEPTYFDSTPNTFHAPLIAPFHAIPLRGEEDEVPDGLLLVAARSPEVDHDVTWIARVLGRQISRLVGRTTIADSRFGQERMLLYSIINAVTDPILLTDTEGKLIIANSHAEKLFAAPEDASEGWRRAVALNNMLFSAALSTSAVAETDLARRELLLVDPLEGSDLLFELLSSRAKDERQGHLRGVDSA